LIFKLQQGLKVNIQTFNEIYSLHHSTESLSSA